MSEEKAKLNFWGKFENFWYYYKWRILSGILLVFAIILTGNVLQQNTQETPSDLKIVSVFAHPLTSEVYDIDKRVEVPTDANADGIRNATLFPYYITEKRTIDNDLVSKEQFDGHLAKADGDLLIFDEVNLSFYLKKDIFEPLDKYVDLSAIPDENIIKKDGIPVAVRLEKSKILSDMRFIIDKVYASVLFVPDDADEVTLKSRENTKAVIEKLLEQ